MVLFGRGIPLNISRDAKVRNQALLVVQHIVGSRESEVSEWVMNNTQKP